MTEKEIHIYWLDFVRDYRLGKVTIAEIWDAMRLLGDRKGQYSYYQIKFRDIRFNTSRNKVLQLMEAALIGLDNDLRRNKIADEMWGEFYKMNERSKRAKNNKTLLNFQYD